MLFQVFIHRSLTIPYYIFFAAIGVISIVRPSSNPEKECTR
ncbi:hypothetical protein [Bacillus velezensis]|nr:hypothetical protein [Bacillus velezensis]